MDKVQKHNSFNTLLGSLKGKDRSEDLCIDRRIILEWILDKHIRRCGLDSPGSG
jgi:hypothetical protein